MGCALSLGPGDLSCLARRAVTHLFFKSVQMVPVLPGVPDAMGDVWPGGGRWVRLVWVGGVGC